MSESPVNNSLECLVCADSFRKLKRLSCGHSFCSACLVRLQRADKVRCPYCRQETELPIFGVSDLPGQFGGTLQCCDCNAQGDINECFWCSVCQLILCKRCVDRRHEDHPTEPANSLGPVKFCIQQLDKLAAVHTQLTIIQKLLVKEYMQQLGEALERELDADLNARIYRLKSEKSHLKQVFDIQSVPAAAQNALPHPLASGGFAYILNEVYKMSPTSLQDWANFGKLSRDGLIFNPLPVDNTVEIFTKQDKFVKFSTSFSTVMKPAACRVPLSYVGAGQLDDVCDICSLPDQDLLLVTCITKGLFCFKPSTGELINVVTPVAETDQFVGVTYEKKHKLFLVAVLRRYQCWVINLYDQRLKLRQVINCPKETQVNNSWYRWLTPLVNGRVLMSSGDQNASFLWVLNLNANRWKQLAFKEGVTYRRAAFNPSKFGREGMLYIPDMKNKTIATYTINTESWELKNPSEIHTEEFTQELPISVEITDGKLIVGSWYTGNIIVADLHLCRSHLLTSVGCKELFSLHALSDGPNKHLAVLCKQKEVVELYKLS